MVLRHPAELPGDILFAIGYQGAKSTFLYAGRNINNGGPHPNIPANQRRVRPTWNNITLRDPGSYLPQMAVPDDGFQLISRRSCIGRTREAPRRNSCS
jgi:hypothetical protein